jgi:hypothetical protein
MRYSPPLLRAILALAIGSWLTLSGAAQDAAPNDLPSGHFAHVTIEKKAGTVSALDFHLDGSGRAVRFYAANSERPTDPRTYFNDNGMLYTNGWMVISGTMSGSGEGFNIEPPSRDPAMLYLWSDILGPALEVRAANAGPESYLFQGLDRDAHYTFSLEQNGTLRWGAASRARMDTDLYRATAKTLRTDGSLVVTNRLGVGAADPSSTLDIRGSQSVRRLAVRSDYTLTDTDYYAGVTDTAAPRTITLPSAAGREGRVYIIKDESAGAGAHPITVRAAAGGTIDGAPALTISRNYGVLRVISSGRNWFSL